MLSILNFSFQKPTATTAIKTVQKFRHTETKDQLLKINEMCCSLSTCSYSLIKQLKSYNKRIARCITNFSLWMHQAIMKPWLTWPSSPLWDCNKPTVVYHSVYYLPNFLGTAKVAKICDTPLLMLIRRNAFVVSLRYIWILHLM